jgi:DNA-binding response OmpR family regulator
MPRQLANGVRDEQPMGEHRGFFINSHIHPIGLGRAKVRLMSSPPTAEAATLRILVTDDNRDAAESLAILLRMAGHEVRIAHDGSAALDVALSFHPRLALVDIGMPRLNGHEVARELRRRVGRTMRLVALTAWGQPTDRRLTKAAGFDEHFVKPIEPAQLDELLEQIHQSDQSDA